MPTVFNGNTISPAPLMNVHPDFIETGDGTRIGTGYTITLSGTLVAVPPGASFVPTAGRLGVLLAKQDILNGIFSVNGGLLEVLSPDGTQVHSCYATVKNIDFAQGIWVDKTEYTITLETPNFYNSDPEYTYKVTEASDNWQIEENGVSVDEDGTPLPVWRLTHTLSAKGRINYEATVDPEGWKQARDWVLSRSLTSNIDGRPFDTKDELKLQGTTGYNHTRLESVDILEGTFTLTETWILAYGVSATEDYTLNVKKSPEDSTISNTVSIAGTVRGLSSEINNPAQKFANAKAYFLTIQDNLFARASSILPGVALSDFGSVGNIDYNPAEGTISYSFDFNDRRVGTDPNVFDSYTVSKTSSIESYEIKVTVAGTIQGRAKITEDDPNTLKWTRALAYWETFKDGAIAFTRAQTTGVAGLQANPAENDYTLRELEGSIDYTFVFNNRLSNLFINTYELTRKYDKQSGVTTVGINGTITGLREHDTDGYLAKYNNAYNAWLLFKPTIPSIVAQYVPDAIINPDPISETLGKQELNGVITYSYEFNTDRIPDIDDALFETINIQDTNPADVFAVIPVLGRQAGPVLQDIGSKKEKVRSVTLDVTMKIGSAKPNTDDIINAFRPAGRYFVDRDEVSWSPWTYRYTRNVSWVWE